MAWLESLTLTIGASIAKHIIKSWVGDNLPNTILGDLVDFLKDEGIKTGERRDVERQIDQIGERIVDRLSPMFESEGIKLEDDQKTSIALELARTLSKAEITSKLLVDCKLDAAALAEKFEEANPQAAKLFSASETTVYNLLLTETSKAIIEVATDLASFQHQFSKDVLQSQDQILERLGRLLAIPDERAQRYEKDYLQTVRNNLDKLDLFGVPQYDTVARKQSLTIAYIALEINLPGMGQDKGEDESTLLMMPATKAEIDSRHMAAERETTRNAPINQLLAQARRIVIRGYAGSGKTTLLKWIAVRSAKRDFPAQLAAWNNTIPFFIPLRDYVGSGFPELEGFPQYVARQVGGKPEDWVHQQLDSGRAIILIDGVDELPAEKRPEMLRQLDQLVSMYPFARYIVTSRPHAVKTELWPEWQEWIAANGFVETALQPMNSTCTEEFIDHWHRALSNIVADEQEKEELSANPGNLKRLLRRRPALRRLATNPLLCAMICALYRERRSSLPAERIKLYQECVEMLISRREEYRMAGLRSDYPELNYSQQIALIQGFAYWLMHNNYSDVETGEADHQFDMRLPNLSVSGITGEQVRHLFVERSSLLREPVVGRIDFAHRTFQEYLAARAAVEAGDFGFLQKNALDDQWQEVIILSAGEARPKERRRLLQGLINKAEKHKRPRNKRQLYLLTLACLETCVDLDPEMRRLVLERAACLFPPKDDDEVKRVASAGEPAVELLKVRPRLKEGEARRCIQALGMIGSDSALEALAEYAQDERFKSLDYVKAWDNFDRHLFAKKVLAFIPALEFNRLDSWEGFEHLSNLRELEVRDSLVTDWSLLASLPNLTQLTLFSENIPNLSSLASLPNLTQLSLYNYNIGSVQVTDTSLLASLHNLTRLILYGVKITDLSPLASLPNLTQLSLFSEKSTNLSSLASLPNLTLLTLSGEITPDLSPLASLTNLTQLTLSGAQITDLSSLASLPNLTQLSLFGENIPNLSSLASLPNLTQLFLYSEKSTDLSSLASLPNLTLLTLFSWNIPDLSPLVSLPNLAQLSLRNAQIADLLLLASLPNLTQLTLYNLGDNEITDLSPFASLPNLTQLSLSGAQITDLSPLASLTNLTQLSLSGTKIADLSPLAEYTSTPRTLGLSSVQLYDLLPDLARLPNLVGLDLAGDRLTNFTPLLKFPHLSKLNLRDTWIHDIGQLAIFTELAELNLSKTYITDLTPLSSLVNLVELDISWTAVTDIRPLIGLPKLRKLNLRGTLVRDISALVDKPDLEIIR